jgi:quinol monooxygenase YgiN
MEVYIFARFHARDGHAAALAATVRAVLAPTRAEPGCIAINAFRSLRDPGLFYIHSRWIDERAFDLHAELPHTRAFVERVEPLIDHPLEALRTILIDAADPAI